MNMKCDQHEYCNNVMTLCLPRSNLCCQGLQALSQCKSLCAGYYADCLQAYNGGTFDSHTCTQSCEYKTTQTKSISTMETIRSTGKGDIISYAHQQIDNESSKAATVIVPMFAGIPVLLLAVILVAYCMQNEFRDSKNSRKDNTIEAELTVIPTSSNLDVSKVKKKKQQQTNHNPPQELVWKLSRFLIIQGGVKQKKRTAVRILFTDPGNESCLSSSSLYIQEQAEVTNQETVWLVSKNNKVCVVVEDMTNPIQETSQTYYQGREIA